MEKILGELFLSLATAFTIAARKLLGVPQPGAASFFVEDETMNLIKVVLPEPGATDVVKRHLNVIINDVQQEKREIVATFKDGKWTAGLVAGGYPGVEGDKVISTHVDEDNAGNMSEPKHTEGVVVDKLAPPQPGEPQFLVEEED